MLHLVCQYFLLTVHQHLQDCWGLKARVLLLNSYLSGCNENKIFSTITRKTSQLATILVWNHLIMWARYSHHLQRLHKSKGIWNPASEFIASKNPARNIYSSSRKVWLNWLCFAIQLRISIWSFFLRFHIQNLQADSIRAKNDAEAKFRKLKTKTWTKERPLYIYFKHH